jgi:hypothetical protein
MVINVIMFSYDACFCAGFFVSAGCSGRSINTMPMAVLL